MTFPPDEQVRRALHVLADLSPTNEDRPSGLAVPAEWFRWLPASSAALLAPAAVLGPPNRTGMAMLPWADPECLVPIDRELGRRLAAVDQIRPAQNSLRVGWLFVTGTVRGHGGRESRVFHPLVTLPVKVRFPVNRGGEPYLVAVGDAEVTELVRDPEVRAALDQRVEADLGALRDVRTPLIPRGLLAQLPALLQFARDAAGAAGLTATEFLDAGPGPGAYVQHEGLAIVAGIAVYATHGADVTSRSGSLRAWATGPLDAWTAFHALYADAPPPPPGTGAPPPTPVADLPSPFVLSPAQQSAVRHTRAHDLTLVSGAPGTGKSHTVAAIACDALAHGQSVLVAARSDATVDALLDLLDRAPGPDPVVFGSNDRRRALAERLAAGQLEPVPDHVVEQARKDCRTAIEAYRERAAAIRAALDAERRAGSLSSFDDPARQAAPALFSPTAQLALADSLAAKARAPRRGIIAALTARHHRIRLAQLAGALQNTPLSELEHALEAAKADHARRQLDIGGGLALTDEWRTLVELDDKMRDRVGRWLEADVRSERRLNRATLPAVAALATALRGGRGTRRHLLTQIPSTELTRALPLWVGSLSDIDDILPAVAGYFDLVILDEASCIDQPLAAAALLRARRAVIVGDPRQLRHVTFISEERNQGALQDHGVANSPMLAARLDVLRNSAFDVAAGVEPVLVLDEHFRSDPHLVDFVAARIYDDNVKVATQAPSTVRRDCVHVRRIEGDRDEGGVVAAEVEWITAHVARLRAAGARSVGVITPFRAQADALEKAVLARFTVEDLHALDLRIGTVHAFQGNERDHVIASIGIGPTEDGSAWRFLQDSHMFATFATRARSDLTIVLSADPPPGLFADYLADADRPPGDPPSGPAANAWIAAIAEDLRAGGAPTATAYPTGRHVLDVCVPGRGDVALDCRVHPDGPDAHIARFLALRRAGWIVHDAYPSRWAHRRAELVLDLLPRLKPKPGSRV